MAGSMTCPRCGAAMRTYQRAGVEVDQCESCRGIFLDRGELERLVTAESTYAAQPPPPPPPPPQYGPPGYPPQGGYYGDEHHGYEHGEYPRRRRGFFHDLFDD